MRIDATIPEREGKALARLAKRLGLSRSELVAEAVSYFLRVSDEMASGRLVLVHDPAGGVPPRELVNRALSYVAAPIAQPRAAEGILGQRPSRSADGAWRKELARLKSLSAYERMAEALDLGDDFETPP